MLVLAVVAGAVVLAGTGAALGATPAENAAFAKGLKKEIGPAFEKSAPKLVLGKVTCVLPSNGAVVQCKAHFAYPTGGLNIVYKIKATLLETGKLRWTTTTHTCTYAKTGKPVSC